MPLGFCPWSESVIFVPYLTLPSKILSFLPFHHGSAWYESVLVLKIVNPVLDTGTAVTHLHWLKNFPSIDQWELLYDWESRVLITYGYIPLYVSVKWRLYSLGEIIQIRVNHKNWTNGEERKVSVMKTQLWRVRECYNRVLPWNLLGWNQDVGWGVIWFEAYSVFQAYRLLLKKQKSLFLRGFMMEGCVSWQILTMFYSKLLWESLRHLPGGFYPHKFTPSRPGALICTAFLLTALMIRSDPQVKSSFQWTQPHVKKTPGYSCIIYFSIKLEFLGCYLKQFTGGSHSQGKGIIQECRSWERNLEDILEFYQSCCFSNS